MSNLLRGREKVWEDALDPDARPPLTRYISVNRMAPDDVFLSLINPPSKNKPVQKLIAKYVFDCYEKRRSLVL